MTYAVLFIRPSLTISLLCRKIWLLAPTEFLFVAFWCAGDLGSQFFFFGYRALVEGGAVPDHFAESRTVFIPKTSDIDDNGRIMR